MKNNSRKVESAQAAMHEALDDTVRKHLVHPFRKPILEHNREAFDCAAEFIARSGAPVVLDSGCGTGESSLFLAALYPDAVVVGVDKSAHRLGKSSARDNRADNVLHIRADLVDFWRLAVEAGWKLHKHYILYPNPWPRPEHLMRRWHGHPVFGCIPALGGQLELRSNWRVYVEEFARACAIATGVEPAVEHSLPTSYATPFERKYALSGQNLYRCNTVFEV